MDYPNRGLLASRTYPLLPFDKIEQFVPELVRLKVSEKSRSPEGFLYNYYLKPELNEFWIKKRNAFLNRTIPAYLKNPTYRRWLSIVGGWAYWIEPLHLKRKIRINY